jgi:hypothetical protein
MATSERVKRFPELSKTGEVTNIQADCCYSGGNREVVDKLMMVSAGWIEFSDA